eukprot:SAG31_NODE_1813_length_7211_cov_9.203600_1_plen_114_part_00
MPMWGQERASCVCRLVVCGHEKHHVKNLSEQHMDYCVLCHKESGGKLGGWNVVWKAQPWMDDGIIFVSQMQCMLRARTSKCSNLVRIGKEIYCIAVVEEPTAKKARAYVVFTW